MRIPKAWPRLLINSGPLLGEQQRDSPAKGSNLPLLTNYEAPYLFLCDSSGRLQFNSSNMLSLQRGLEEELEERSDGLSIH